MSTVQSVLQNCIRYVYSWCVDKRLYMNIKKTKIMWFGTDTFKTDNVEDTVCISGQPIERVYTYPYLGVELDSILSLDNVVSKCTQKLYIFRRIQRLISVETAVLIYKQTIRPLVEYCSFIFNSGKKTKVDRIDKIQSKCL